MKPPLISVCLPNLNTFPYLQERVDTIFAQTYQNWELVISDNHSEDGAGEFFQKLARKDRRVSIAQAPREGLYSNWNNCIRRSEGRYVYIATSDDTMAPDCLEKLAGALEQHDDCDLAHCPLMVIDEVGAAVDDPKWPDCTVFAVGMPELIHRGHVRRAPFDGLLHLTGRMVYLSITQLLIRRSLFDRIGGFESRWGSIGDLNWDMKAGLVANTVHVPDTWASFRVHHRQATASVNFFSIEYGKKVEEMIRDAVLKCESYLAPEVVTGLKSHWLDSSRDLRSYYRSLRERQNPLHRRFYQMSQLLSGPEAVRSEVIDRLRRRPKWSDRVVRDLQHWLESIGTGPVVEPTSGLHL